MLGGTAILDERGRILWIERPFHERAEFYIGRSVWDFTGDEEATRRAQEAFTWTLGMGGRHQRQGHSGKHVPAAEWRYDYERIQVSHCVVVNRFALLSPVHFTRTEERVAALLVRDLSAAEICEALNITANTMQTHRRNLLAKVRARGIAGLTRWWDERARWL